MTVWVLESSGQSNCEYPGRGEVYSNAAVRLFYYNPTTTDTSGDLWIDMKGNTANSGGYDATIVRLLLAAGVAKLAVLNWTYGSSAYNRWDPAGPYLAGDILNHRAIALAGLRAQYPGETVFNFIHLRNQGTTDMQINNQTYQQGWAAGNDLWHNGLVSQNVQLGFRPHVIKMAVMSFTGLDVSFFNPTIMRQQLIWVGGTPPADTSQIGDDPRLVKLENALGYDADGTHMKAASVTIDGVTYPGGGYQWAGSVIAPKILEQMRMGTLSPFTKTTMVNHLRNKATYTPAATHYLHLYGDAALTAPLTSGNSPGYAVQSNANNTTTYPTPSGRAVSNAVAFTFTPSGTGSLPVWGWKLTDSATEGAGNLLVSHSMASPLTWAVAQGPISAGIGAITISFPTNDVVGGFEDAVAHGLLGLVFGGTAYTQLTATFGSYWAGDPSGAGAQAGSRVSMTQATTWGSASGGQSLTTASVALAQQVTGTYWAEHDASVAGNLIATAPRSASVGVSGTLLPSQIQTTIT